MAIEFRLPDIGEGVAEGEIVQWLVRPGDAVREDQPLVEVMTDKVTAEIPSPCAGVIKELKAVVGEVVKVGAVLVVFEEAVASHAHVEPSLSIHHPALPTAASDWSSSQPAPSPVNGGGTAVLAPVSHKVLAAPATRKLARQLGVDLSQVAGSGPRGRVTPADVRGVTTTGNAPKPSFQPVLAPPALVSASVPEERKPFAGMRRKIGERLAESKRRAPHFAYVEEVDMTEVVRMRGQLRSVAQEEGVKLTYLPFILKAVIAGLKAYPMLNAMLDEERQELVYKGYYNLGVAMATDQGLLVPVVKQADTKSLLELAQEIQALSERARAGKLSVEDLRGGTFTVTSIGSIGGLFGIPILNYPEVGILGVNKIAQRPVVRDGEIVIREMMHLSLSCDHRVVDGAEAAQFMNRVVEILENPARLLLN